jgi:hypothetical protein
MGGYHSDLDEGLEDPGVTHISDADGKLQKVDFIFFKWYYQFSEVCSYNNNIIIINIFLYNIKKDLNLLYKKSIDKHIPHQYLYGTLEDRISLLQGLCDTDGYADSTHFEYSTSSESPATSAQTPATVLPVGSFTLINVLASTLGFIGTSRPGSNRQV